jgi:hypothetical protein
VIVGQLGDPEPGAAVLAGVGVPGVDVDPRELDWLVVPTERAQEPDHGRDLEDDRDRPDLVAVLLDHLDLAEEQERDRPLPRDDLDRFVALRQEERGAGRVHRWAQA